MAVETSNTHLNEAILTALEETFENVKGIYLDKGTSLFETLASISAEEASQPISSNCASISAHVEHLSYYMEILLQFVGGEQPKTDWQYIWLNVGEVSEEEWADSQQKLKATYSNIRSLVSHTPFDNPTQIQGALGILMHNAYHLGQIHQSLCTIKPS